MYPAVRLLISVSTVVSICICGCAQALTGASIKATKIVMISFVAVIAVSPFFLELAVNTTITLRLLLRIFRDTITYCIN